MFSSFLCPSQRALFCLYLSLFFYLLLYPWVSGTVYFFRFCFRFRFRHSALSISISSFFFFPFRPAARNGMMSSRTREKFHLSICLPVPSDCLKTVHPSIHTWVPPPQEARGVFWRLHRATCPRPQKRLKGSDKTLGEPERRLPESLDMIEGVQAFEASETTKRVCPMKISGPVPPSFYT